MSQRRTVLIPGERYHIFNRSTGHRVIFPTTRDYQRAIELLHYYCYQYPPVKFSDFIRMPILKKEEVVEEIQRLPLLVEIEMFCLMPTHFHLLLKEVIPGGIVRFLSNFQNSYAKYFNTKFSEHGSVFQNRFKNVHIKNDEQYIQVQRYITQNPLEAGLVQSEEELPYYPWFKSYLVGGN